MNGQQTTFSTGSLWKSACSLANLLVGLPSAWFVSGGSGSRFHYGAKITVAKRMERTYLGMEETSEFAAAEAAKPAD